MNHSRSMILVPAGPFFVGLDEGEIRRICGRYDADPCALETMLPRREVELPDFHIDKYPVTNADYYEFAVETNTPWLFDKDNPPPPERENMPAASVTYHDAEAYAKWAGKRLPTQQEWEKAARGRRGLLFPWGNLWDAARCFCAASDPHSNGGLGPVDAHPNGASPYGVMDMSGNVCEWTSTPHANGSMVIRGGHYMQADPVLFLAAYNNLSESGQTARDHIGFRCVAPGEP